MATPFSKKKKLEKPATPIGKQPLLDDFDLESLHSYDDGVANLLVTTEQITPRYTGEKLVSVANGASFKVIIIGNSAVGKTRMIYQFVNDELPPEMKQETIGVEYYGKTIVFGMVDKATRTPVHKSMRVSYFDTAGQEKYDAITTAHYRKAMGAVVVYSVTDRDSFLAVDKWVT